MIIKEKRWLSRFVAMLCVLTMVVGVLTPASVGVAAGVTQITVSVNDNIKLYDEDIEEINLADSTEWECTSYKYSCSNGKLILKPVSGENLSGTVIIYTDSEIQPKIESSQISNIGSVPYTDDRGKFYWQIKITVGKKLTGTPEVTISKGTPKYTVSIPEGNDYYVELLGNTKFDTNSRNITAAEGDTIDFNVTVEANKEVNVTAYLGEPVPTKEPVSEATASPNTYSYELTVKPRNTTVKISVVDKTYTITEPESGDGYLYVPNNTSTKVVPGGSFSFYVYPQDGYDAPTVKVQTKQDDTYTEPGETLTGYNNLYVISNITADKKIVIDRGDGKQYKVSFDEGTGYSFSEIKVNSALKENAGTYSIDHGKNVTFKVSASDGYRITRVSANSTILTVGGDGSYTLENVTVDTVISVVVQKISYTIIYPTSNPSEGYRVVSGATSAGYGDFVTFNVIPEAGFKTPTVTAKYEVNAPEITTKPIDVINVGGTQYRVEIKGKTEISVGAAGKEDLTIYYNTGEGYEFYASDSMATPAPAVTYGNDVTFKLHVDKHYSDSTPIVLANGKTVTVTSDDESLEDGKDYTCTIAKVTENQVVSVTGIQKNTYTVTLEDGNGYALTTTQSTSVTANSKFSFKWNISSGYTKPSAIDITGSEHTDLDSHNGSYGLTGNCSFTVTGNTTVKLSGVEEEEYTVQIEGDETDKATITQVGSVGTNNIKYGESYSFTVKADTYYQVTNVLLNGIAMEPSRNNVYTVGNIQNSNNVIKIETRKNKLTVNYSGARYGKAVDTEEGTEGNIEVTCDNETILKDLDGSKPKNCIYEFVGWTWDGNVKPKKSVEMTDLQEFIEESDAEINITASWKVNKDAVESGIKVKTGAESQQSGKYKLTFKCIVNLIEDSIGDEHKKDVKITGYGIVYGADEIGSLNDTDIQRIKDRKTGETENNMYKDSLRDSKRMFNYFMNTDLTIADISDGNFFHINSEVSSNNSKRYGLAWMELTVGDEKIIIYGSQETLPSL